MSFLQAPITLWAFPCFLVQEHAPRSFYTFPDPAPDSAISARSPGSWELKLLFRSQDLSTKHAYCLHYVSVSRPSQRTEPEKSVCFCRPRHTHTFTTTFHFYVHLCKLKTMSSHQSCSILIQFSFHSPENLNLASIILIHLLFDRSPCIQPICLFHCRSSPVLAQALTAHAEPALLSLLRLWAALESIPIAVDSPPYSDPLHGCRT